VPAFATWIPAAIVVAVGLFRAGRAGGRKRAAAAIEQACPNCRNLVITAEELERCPQHASARAHRRTVDQADAILADVHAAAIVPLRSVLLPFAIALVLFALTLPNLREPMRRTAGTLTARAASVITQHGVVRVIVEPPSYSRLERTVHDDPVRIEALEGSRIRFELPSAWRVRYGNTMVPSEIVAKESGYFAIEAPERETRLIPLAVARDRAPSVKITAPAKDLLLPDGSRTIPIDLSASDDLGLRALELRYTKVSGSGEHFEFDEGTLTADLTRTSERDWHARAALALSSLRLGPGDSLVYRAVARDRRPGDAGTASSDTYFIEIAGPGQIALAGIDMPPELDRYAMSQQMIVVKLERLQKRVKGMPAAALSEEAASIAAEQRTVRANFVFLLGGHVEDEEEEAAQSHEIQEGRLENTARKDINAAISQMTRAEQALAAVNVNGALPPARAAVDSLQRAFGHSRYLLRSLASSSRLDPSRRLSGELNDAGEWLRTKVDAEAREGARVRELLAMLLQLVQRSPGAGRPDAAGASRAAEFALSIDPASPIWQGVARELTAGPDSAALQRAIATVAHESLRGTIPRTNLTPRSSLERAYSSERRQ
jgi:hypothetical protein